MKVDISESFEVSKDHVLDMMKKYPKANQVLQELFPSLAYEKVPISQLFIYSNVDQVYIVQFMYTSLDEDLCIFTDLRSQNKHNLITMIKMKVENKMVYVPKDIFNQLVPVDGEIRVCGRCREETYRI